jgi:hypothetical protein
MSLSEGADPRLLRRPGNCPSLRTAAIEHPGSANIICRNLFFDDGAGDATAMTADDQSKRVSPC